MERNQRLYTVDQANAVVQHVRPWLLELQQLVGQLDQVNAQLEGIGMQARANGRAIESEELMAHIARLTEAARAIIENLIELGIEIKDPRRGLIDFHSLRAGRVVYLCWQLGEGKIAYWHELDAGFAGRQPMDEES